MGADRKGHLEGAEVTHGKKTKKSLISSEGERKYYTLGESTSQRIAGEP